MISPASVQRGWPMLLPLLPHHQRREGEVPFPRERCVLSQDYPKKKIIIIIIIITYILFSKEKKNPIHIDKLWL